MCFTDDYDWYASIVEDEILTATKLTKCDECSREIQEEEWIRHIFMQEHEECQNGEYPDDDDSELVCPKDCEHDYGETCDYDRCETCDQFIEAIHQHELAEGCSESESRPN